MKASTVKIVAILLSGILGIGMLWAFLCIGMMSWERSWMTVESMQGPDGYTYCLMCETGIGQDPHTKLVRTKNPNDEESYEDLSQTNEVSSRLPVIRPAEYACRTKQKLHLVSNNYIFIIYDSSLGNYVPFIYDIANNQFYEEHDNNTMSPFILIENEDVELYGPDIAWVISYVVNDYNSYREQQQYISKDIKDAASLIHKYVPQWPTRDALDKGLVHQNQEVQKISKWILHIQQNGSDDDSETGREIREFLEKYDDM